jgi:cell division protein FtsZ
LVSILFFASSIVSICLSHPNKKLVEHLTNVRKIGLEIFENKESLKFRFSKDIIRNVLKTILYYHDIGKATIFFQDYLRASIDKKECKHKQDLINHSLISALIVAYKVMQNTDNDFLAALSFACVRKHHGNFEKLEDMLATNKESILRKQFEALDLSDFNELRDINFDDLWNDTRDLFLIDVDKKMHLGKDILGEHKDANGEVRVAEYIISRNKAWILEEANNADVIVLLAALGGGTGTGGILETAKIIKEKFDKPVVAIMILPFSIEGKRREIAIETVNEVKTLVTKSIVLDSDIILQKPSVKVSEAYNILYDEISNFVEKITNVTRREIERKFREMYMKEVDTIVEEIYNNILIAA